MVKRLCRSAKSYFKNEQIGDKNFLSGNTYTPGQALETPEQFMLNCHGGHNNIKKFKGLYS